MFSAQSQKRTEEAQLAGRFDNEIVPVTTTMAVIDKNAGTSEQREVTISKDACNRPGTTADALSKLSPVNGPTCFVTAGNASQLSDGCLASTTTAADDN